MSIYQGDATDDLPVLDSAKGIESALRDNGVQAGRHRPRIVPDTDTARTGHPCQAAKRPMARTRQELCPA